MHYQHILLVLQANEDGVFSFPHVITKAMVNPGKYCTDAIHPHHPKSYSFYYNGISDTLLTLDTYLTGIWG